MSETFDFERYWLEKLARSVEELVGDETRAAVMAGSEGLSGASSRQEVITWTRAAMGRLERLVDKPTSQAVLTGCACRYPPEDLRPMRRAYARTGDVAAAHALLQAQFESFLGRRLGLREEMVTDIRARGWGAAGLLEGHRIVATKIPKSEFLVQYMKETHPTRRRALYCHCPRVRDALQAGEALPRLYCYCGAGYYKGIWEEILRQPVEVELLESVLAGADVCRVAIHLPPT